MEFGCYEFYHEKGKCSFKYLVLSLLFVPLVYSLTSFLINYNLNIFQPSVAFHIETSHLFCSANQKTDFYMKLNTGLKWVEGLHSSQNDMDNGDAA